MICQLPSQIDGVAVIDTQSDMLPSGALTVRFIPTDPADDRIWEMNLTTGAIALIFPHTMSQS